MRKFPKVVSLPPVNTFVKPSTRCCARCIRGTRATPGPCGRGGECVCHYRQSAQAAQKAI